MGQDNGIGVVGDRANEYLAGMYGTAVKEPDAHGAHLKHLMRSAERDRNNVLLRTVDKVLEEWQDIARAADPDTLRSDASP